MEKTRIIMTEVLCSQGKYTRFSLKDTGYSIAFVDRKDGRYEIYAGYPFIDKVGTRTNKDSALRLAKESILKFIPDAEFKFNVVRERVR